MRSMLFILLMSQASYFAFGQGRWNIGYIEVDSIETSHIGKSVRIDFRHHSSEGNATSKWVRSYVIPEDSATITLNGRQLRVTEKRNIYVDHGSFDDQYLEILDDDNALVERIYDTKLIEIEGDKFKFLITVETYKIQNKREGKIDSKAMEVWIHKGSLDGLMIKI